MYSNEPDNQVVTDRCNVDACSSLQADLKDATKILFEVCDGSPNISYLPRSGPGLKSQKKNEKHIGMESPKTNQTR